MKENFCETSWAGKELIYQEETGSTNADAVRLASELPHGTVIMADSQTAGRGRRGRTWVSPKGENLYFSLLLKPSFPPEQASMLTLVMALAVACGIEDLYGNQKVVQIKWPNDIVVCGKKVCGILTEMQVNAGNISHVVIGIGINVNQMCFEGEALAFASSLKKETGLEKNRMELLQRILSHFEVFYEVFCEAGSLQPMLKPYEMRLANLYQEVLVLDPKGEYKGIAQGILNTGELIVRRKDDGKEIFVYAGEVSVRGLFGYV